MFEIDGTMIVYTAIIVLVSLIAGFGIGSYLKNMSNRELLEALEDYDKMHELEEKIKKVLEEIVVTQKEHALSNLEFNKKIINMSNESSENTLNAIYSRLDDKIATLIEEAQHIEKNKDNDINHFYG